MPIPNSLSGNGENKQMIYYITENFLWGEFACSRSVECLRAIAPNESLGARLTERNCDRWLREWNKTKKWSDLTNWLSRLCSLNGIYLQVKTYLQSEARLEYALDRIQPHRRAKALYQILYRIAEKRNRSY
jgi:hypothetical protein